MKRNARILAGLLALLLCVGMWPFAAAAEAETLLFECEDYFSDAVGASVQDMDGASGGKKVGGAGNNGARWFKMEGMEIPAAGSYRMEIVYTACTDGRTLRVGVNGVDGTDGLLLMAPKLSSATALGTVTAYVTLPAGDLSIKIYSVDSGEGYGDSQWCPDIDCIKLTPGEDPGPGGEEPVLPDPVDGWWVYECESCIGVNFGGQIKSDASASGGGKVGSIGRKGAAWFTMADIVVPLEGIYNAEMRYYASDARTFRVGVNGVGGPDGLLVKPAAVGNWTDPGTVTFSLRLKKGANTVRIYSMDPAKGKGDTEWCPDFDCLRISAELSDQDNARLEVENLIAAVGEVTPENAASVRPAIEAAEAALASYAAAYGEEAAAAVEGVQALAEARRLADVYYYTALAPALTDGYWLYEAEADTTILEGATRANDAVASGGKKIGGLGNDGGRAFVMPGVVVPETGIYTVEVHYAGTREAAGRTFRIGVNGQPGDLQHAAPTPDLETIGVMTVLLPLEAGVNRLRFYNEPSSKKLGDTTWCPDIDCLLIYASLDGARELAVRQVEDLIMAIKDFDETNYNAALPSIQAAEMAAQRLVNLYGEEALADVEHYEYLLNARAAYDAYSQPQEVDGYIRYECENQTYTVLRGSSVGTNSAGTGLVKNLRPNGATGFTMTLPAEQDGWYDLRVGYVNGDSTRPCGLTVNGRLLEVHYPNTGTWNDGDFVPLTLPLRAGENTLTFATLKLDEEPEPGQGYGPDFDYVDVAELPTADPTPQGDIIPVDDAALSVGLGLTDDDFALVGARIDGFGQGTGRVSWPVTVAADGYYHLWVEASQTELSSVSLVATLTDTGTRLPTLTLRGGVSASQFAYLPFDVEWTAGTHTLEIAVADEGVSLGSLIIAPFAESEIVAFRAEQIKQAVQQIGRVTPAGYVEQAAAAAVARERLNAFDADYGEEGRAKVPDSVRNMLAGQEAACAAYAEAKEHAGPAEQAIAAIGPITADNAAEKLPLLETAEQAVASFCETYGDECTALVEGYEDLLTARKTYDELTGYTRGDVNADGAINASDALMALQHSVRLITLEGGQALAADVNLDDQINASDALLILQYSVKLITAFPD